jgi:hypothetical protein
MKSFSFACSLRLLAALVCCLAPSLLAQTTNLVNDGTTVANLTLLANTAGTAGATLSLTPDAGALRADQSPDITDMALNGVWFNDRIFPASNRYAVLVDIRPTPRTSWGWPPGWTPTAAKECCFGSGPAKCWERWKWR